MKTPSSRRMYAVADKELEAKSRAKELVAQHVVRMIEDGMRLGIGTGSTAALAIACLGRRIQNEGLDVRGVPTSFAAEQLARDHGIPTATLNEVERLDLAFDGADEVDPQLNLIKGRGGAHSREKVVAALAERFVVMVDQTKLVDVLGTQAPVPIEVLPFAASPVGRMLESRGASVSVRVGGGKDGPVVTDQGMWILDAKFDGISDPEALSRTLDSIPGVLDHGLFVEMTQDLVIGGFDGSVEHRSA